MNIQLFKFHLDPLNIILLGVSRLIFWGLSLYICYKLRPAKTSTDLGIRGDFSFLNPVTLTGSIILRIIVYYFMYHINTYMS